MAVIARPARLTQAVIPPLGKLVITREQLAFDEAVCKVEADEVRRVAYPKLNDANLLLPFVDLPRLEKPKEEAAN